MSISFSILLENKNRFTELINLSKKHFKIDYSRTSSNFVTLLEQNSNYMIKIGSNSMKFVIAGDDSEKINMKINEITNFISQNFLNETIGIKYYDGSNKMIDKIDGVELINLH